MRFQKNGSTLTLLLIINSTTSYLHFAQPTLENQLESMPKNRFASFLNLALQIFLCF